MSMRIAPFKPPRLRSKWLEELKLARRTAAGHGSASGCTRNGCQRSDWRVRGGSAGRAVELSEPNLHQFNHATLVVNLSVLTTSSPDMGAYRPRSYLTAQDAHNRRD